MKDILCVQTLLAARLGFDITDYHVMSYFKLEKELIRAAKNGNLDTIKFIVSVGVDIKLIYSWHFDDCYSFLSSDELIFKLSAAYGHLNVVKYLVSRGANIHAQDDFALRFAAKYGYLNVVEYLVLQGANIHAQNDFAFKYAEKNGYLNVVKYLNEAEKDGAHASYD